MQSFKWVITILVTLIFSQIGGAFVNYRVFTNGMENVTSKLTDLRVAVAGTTETVRTNSKDIGRIEQGLKEHMKDQDYRVWPTPRGP